MTAGNDAASRRAPHPAGLDGELQAALDEVRIGRWVAMGDLLAKTGTLWELRTSRSLVLGAVRLCRRPQRRGPLRLATSPGGVMTGQAGPSWADLDLNTVAEVLVGVTPGNRHSRVHEFAELRRVGGVPQTEQREDGPADVQVPVADELAQG